MHHLASLPLADNWTDASRNKSSVSLSSNAIRPIPDPQAGSGDGRAGTDGRVIETVDQDHSFVAASAAMVEVRRQVQQLAGIDVPVLIVGECGTGKELVARMIHKLSGRSARDFFKVNCSALPAELLENELYGQEAGFFSADPESRAGQFELANKGTILLDDVAGLPLAAQPRLLKVLQEGEFVRKGSSAGRHCDVRVIAASDRGLREPLNSGTLRADLYYRLNGFTISLPPLRERREDVPYLLEYFMRRWSSEYGRPPLPITRAILETSSSYSWPGNVRELENFVKRYVVLGDESLALDQIDLDSELPTHADPIVRPDISGKDVCDLKSVVRDLKQDAEKAAILQALERTHGNKQEAASLLHISLRALHYKVRAYGIESASLRTPNFVGFPEGTATFPAQQKGAPSRERTRNAAGKVLTMARSGTR